MSVLVKGMEMPTCCCVCPCFNDEYCYCQAADKDLGSIPIDHRHPDCPLVSVPPHGRLIDADELIEKQKEDAEIFMGSTNYGDKVRYDEAMNAVANIVNAPTVIPADKEGET